MLEYVFFHPQPLQSFLEFLDRHGVPWSRDEDTESLLVRVPEDLEESLSESIEDCYDGLLAQTEDLLEEPRGREEYAGAGIRVPLSDGRVTIAVIEPGLLNKVMQGLSYAELEQFVSTIVQAVEHPDTRTVCQRVRAGDDIP